MAIYGSVDVDLSIYGDVTATVTMDDSDYTLAPNKHGEVYGIMWKGSDGQPVEFFSKDAEFDLGHVSDTKFDKTKPMYINGFARTKRPWHFTKFRALTQDFTLVVTQEYVDNLPPKPPTDNEPTTKKPIWLEPMLHQMMA